MALTTGTGPFGKSPSGVFDKIRRPEGAVLYWEPWPKRFRVLHDGEMLCDTRGAYALHETGHLMRLYVPREDTVMARLTASEKRTRCPWKGEARYWNAGGAADAVWAYEAPLESASFLRGFVCPDLGKLRRWMMEEDEGYAHPRDPYHRFDIHRSDQHVIARAGEKLIAETRQPLVLFETSLPPRYYIPRSDIKGTLVRSETTTDCPYKGPARHWHVEAGLERVEDAAWSLSHPIGEAERIGDAVCFYPGKVTVEVDGERLDH